MWIMMLLSYAIVSLIDTKGFTNAGSKGILTLYIVLMTISCAIGIANGYVPHMPSPADPIRKVILLIIGG